MVTKRLAILAISIYLVLFSTEFEVNAQKEWQTPLGSVNSTQVLKAFVEADITSYQNGLVFPNFQYPILGINSASGSGMYLVDLGFDMGWICANPEYAVAGFPESTMASPLPIESSSTYDCTAEDLSYDPTKALSEFMEFRRFSMLGIWRMTWTEDFTQYFDIAIRPDGTFSFLVEGSEPVEGTFRSEINTIDFYGPLPFKWGPSNAEHYIFQTEGNELILNWVGHGEESRFQRLGTYTYDRAFAWNSDVQIPELISATGIQSGIQPVISATQVVSEEGVVTPDQSFKCGSAVSTNLFIGARAKVAFVTGSWSFQLYNEPHQGGGDAGSLIDGSRVNIVDGPICADNAIWWKLDAFWDYKGGWAPEVAGSGRYLLRLTQDPADTSAVFDPLWTETAEYMVEAESVMKVYQDATPRSSVIDTIWPGTAHQIIGQNMSGMYQITEGWICANRGYLTNNGKPLGSRLMVSDSSAPCAWEDFYVDPDTELQIMAQVTGATYYPPGQYPLMQQFSEQVAKAISGVGATADTVMSKASSVLGLIANGSMIVKRFVTEGGDSPGQTVDIVCAVADLQNLGITIGEPVPELTSGQTMSCIAQDTTMITAETKSVAVGKVYLVTQLFLNHMALNEFVDTSPLTRGYCKIFKCYGGPGASN